jgi:hypothetical protein
LDKNFDKPKIRCVALRAPGGISDAYILRSRISMLLPVVHEVPREWTSVQRGGAGVPKAASHSMGKPKQDLDDPDRKKPKKMLPIRSELEDQAVPDTVHCNVLRPPDSEESLMDSSYFGGPHPGAHPVEDHYPRFRTPHSFLPCPDRLSWLVRTINL